MSWVVAPAGTGMGVTVRITIGVPSWPHGPRSVTFPPRLVDTEVSSSAAPLFLMSRYPTVDAPVLAGWTTFAPVGTMPDPPAWLRPAQPLAVAAISATVPTTLATRLNLCTRPGYRCLPAA